MLEVKELSVIAGQHRRLLDQVSLTLETGRITGLTGASGAGKTTVLRSILGILNRHSRIVCGDILLDGRSLKNLPPAAHRSLCGNTIGFIPQNPMTAFDHRLSIRCQIQETLKIRKGMSPDQADQTVIPLLDRLGISAPGRLLESFPDQLSGGMLQRVAIVLLLAMKPAYILADEPTSALDEENRRLLLQCLAAEKEDAGILFVSHDAGALTKLCEHVCIMEQGRITEQGPMPQLLNAPSREWTRRFAAAAENTDQEGWLWKDC